MTSCMIPHSLTISGNLNELESIKWQHKNSLFRPVDTVSINIDSTASTPAGGGYEFWVYGGLQYKQSGKIKWRQSSVRKIVYRDKDSFPVAQIEYYRIWPEDGNLAAIKQIDFQQIIDSVSIIYGDSERNTLDISEYRFEDHYPPALYGGEGPDKIIGSSFNDTLGSSSSRDICDIENKGNLSIKTKDILVGGKGSDTFYADNGSVIKDIEEGEVIYLYNDSQNYLNSIEDKTPVFKQKSKKTIIKIGDIRIKTNLASYSHSHYFYNGTDLCWTTEAGSNCDIGYITGMPEGYAFSATEVF